MWQARIDCDALCPETKKYLLELPVNLCGKDPERSSDQLIITIIIPE
jgi:hypothetical protein